MNNPVTVAQYPKSEIPELHPHPGFETRVYNLPTLDKPPRSAQR